MTAASNCSTMALDEADLTEARSPINDRDQETVSSATNNLGGQPVALGSSKPSSRDIFCSNFTHSHFVLTCSPLVNQWKIKFKEIHKII
jgi:hypothetical protein